MKLLKFSLYFLIILFYQISSKNNKKNKYLLKQLRKLVSPPKLFDMKIRMPKYRKPLKSPIVINSEKAKKKFLSDGKKEA